MINEKKLKLVLIEFLNFIFKNDFDLRLVINLKEEQKKRCDESERKETYLIRP